MMSSTLLYIRQSCCFFFLLTIAYFTCLHTSFAEYEGSTFNEVRDELLSDQYEELPYYQVTKDSFGPKTPDNENSLRAAAERTLSSQIDLLAEPQQKLLHPNGTCLTGIWEITEPSPWSGLFSPHSRALLIARASVALSHTQKGHQRAFGIAGKIYPTNDKNKKIHTVNFFTMETLAGKMHPHFTDAILTNAPDLGIPKADSVREFFETLGIASRVGFEFSTADSDPTFRPLDPIAQSGTTDPSTVKSPYWMKLQYEETQKVEEEDFRIELEVDHYEKSEIIYQLYAADKADSKTKAEWIHIGRIILDETVTSLSCDQRLHFAHPRLE